MNILPLPFRPRRARAVARGGASSRPRMLGHPIPAVVIAAPAAVAAGPAYYRQLEAGANHLAETALDPADRAEHVRMAAVYRLRAFWG